MLSQLFWTFPRLSVIFTVHSINIFPQINLFLFLMLSWLLWTFPRLWVNLLRIQSTQFLLSLLLQCNYFLVSEVHGIFEYCSWGIWRNANYSECRICSCFIVESPLKLLLTPHKHLCITEQLTSNCQIPTRNVINLVD